MNETETTAEPKTDVITVRISPEDHDLIRQAVHALNYAGGLQPKLSENYFCRATIIGRAKAILAAADPTLLRAEAETYKREKRGQ